MKRVTRKSVQFISRQSKWNNHSLKAQKPATYLAKNSIFRETLCKVLPLTEWYRKVMHVQCSSVYGYQVLVSYLVLVWLSLSVWLSLMVWVSLSVWLSLSVWQDRYEYQYWYGCLSNISMNRSLVGYRHRYRDYYMRRYLVLVSVSVWRFEEC